jgi:hypothetical protein
MTQGPNISAGLLTGYKFFVHPDNPTLGVLRLDTKTGKLWVAVTRKGLSELSKACAEHVDDLKEVQ